jgi:hypothetical protein
MPAMDETFFPNSSAICSAAYDDETQELTIRLTTGRIYVYREVQEWAYDELRAASSAGEYYNLRIKDRHPYSEIVEQCGAPDRPRRSVATSPSPRPIDPSRGSRARRLQSRRARRGA